MLAQWRSVGFSAGVVPSSIHIVVIVLYLVGSLCTGNVLCINIAGRHRDRANRAHFTARTVTVVMDFGIGITAGFMDVGLKTKVSVSMAVASVLVLRLRLCPHVRLNGNVCIVSSINRRYVDHNSQWCLPNTQMFSSCLLGFSFGYGRYTNNTSGQHHVTQL